MGTAAAWWAQPKVNEGPIAIGGCLTKPPCEQSLETLDGPAAAGDAVRRAEAHFRNAISLDPQLAEAQSPPRSPALPDKSS